MTGIASNFGRTVREFVRANVPVRSVILLVSMRPFVCEQVYVSAGLCMDLALLVGAVTVCIQRGQAMPLRARDALFCGLVFACLWSLPGSANQYLTLRMALTFGVYASVGVAVQRFVPHERRWLVNSMIAGAGIIALRGIYQYSSGFAYVANLPLMEPVIAVEHYAGELIKQRRVVSWFSAPNILAAYSILMLPLAGAQGLALGRAGRKKAVAVCGAVTAAIGCVLVMAQSVGAVVALGAAFFGAAVFAQGRGAARFPRHLMRVTIALLVLASACLVIVRYNAFANLRHPENSFRQRVYYWQSAGRLLQQHPGTGIGAGTFGIVYPQVKHPRANETVFAHNSFLQFGAETGLLGGIMLLAFLVYTSRALGRAADIITSGMLIGSMAFLLHNAVDYAVYIPQVAITWIALLACAMPAIMPETKPCLPGWRALLQGMFIASCCGLACCIALVCVGERAIEQGMVRLSEGSLSDACRHWQRASRSIPWSDTPYYLLAECAARTPLPHISPLALYYYQQAIERNPRYAFYYAYVAQYFIRYGENERALEFLTKARAAYPHNEQFERAAQQLSRPSSSD